MPIDINSIKYVPDLPAAKALQSLDLLHLNQQTVDCSITLTVLAAFMANLQHPIGSLIFYGDKSHNPNTDFPGQTWVRVAQGASLRGCQANESDLGTTAGADSVTVSADNMPQHRHGLSSARTTGAGAHNHTITVQNAGAHDHGGQTGTSAAGSHSHSGTTTGAGGHAHEFVGDDDLYKGGATRIRRANPYDADSDTSNFAWWYATSSVGDHAHGLQIDGVGDHGHTVTIRSDGSHAHNASSSGVTDHSHVFDVNQSTDNVGSGTALSVLNRTLYVAVWKRTV